MRIYSSLPTIRQVLQKLSSSPVLAKRRLSDLLDGPVGSNPVRLIPLPFVLRTSRNSWRLPEFVVGSAGHFGVSRGGVEEGRND
jgi:hypothetical protein